MNNSNEGPLTYILPPNSEQFVYRFPLSDEDIRTVNSKEELRYILNIKYNELKGRKQFAKFVQGYNIRQLSFPYSISQSRYCDSYRQNEVVINAKCVICTSYIQFRKPVFSQKPFELSKICYDHLHVPSDKIREEHYLSSKKKREICSNTVTYRTQTTCTLTIKKLDFSKYERTESGIKAAIRELPYMMASQKKESVICDQFKISSNEYFRIMKSLFDDDHDITIDELFKKMQAQNIQVRTLPHDFLDKVRMTDKEKKAQATAEPKHQLPEVLLIISPQMKEMYRLYGQYMGFDLTFSLIRERPEDAYTEGKSKEYLVGVFAGTSESRKIVVFGMVITKKQDTMSYVFLFEKFFEVMKVCPETIVSDQQLTIASALKHLKQKGVFTGIHLLDMFHILKKFRKVAQNEAFQLFRQMMHSKTKGHYQYLFTKVKQQICNDQQVKILSYFDKHSDKYCYCKIKPSFVGIGISDSMNEKFHDIIKEKMQFETKYVKAIGMMMDIIRERNTIARQAVIEKIPMQQYLQCDFLKRYRFKISFKMYDFLVAEVSKSFSLVLIDEEQQFHGNRRIMKNKQGLKYQVMSLSQDHHPHQSRFDHSSFQSSHRTDQVAHNINRLLQSQQQEFHYSEQIQYRFAQRLKINQRPTDYMRTFKLIHYDGIFHVRKKDFHSLWECNCYMFPKAGMPCSHILKVMMHLNQLIFDDYIHPRWFIDQDNISKSQVFTPRAAHTTIVRMRTQCLKPSPEYSYKNKRIDMSKLKLPMTQIQEENEDSESLKEEIRKEQATRKMESNRKIQEKDFEQAPKSSDEDVWQEEEGGSMNILSKLEMKTQKKDFRDRKYEVNSFENERKRRGRPRKHFIDENDFQLPPDGEDYSIQLDDFE